MNLKEREGNISFSPSFAILSLIFYARYQICTPVYTFSLSSSFVYPTMI